MVGGYAPAGVRSPTVGSVLALSFETARDSALAIVAGAVVLAVVLAAVAKAVVSKLMALVVLAAVAVVVWSQRAAVQDCADRVGATLSAGAVDDTTCTFFGREVTVASPLD